MAPLYYNLTGEDSSEVESPTFEEETTDNQNQKMMTEDVTAEE